MRSSFDYFDLKVFETRTLEVSLSNYESENILSFTTITLGSFSFLIMILKCTMKLLCEFLSDSKANQVFKFSKFPFTIKIVKKNTAKLCLFEHYFSKEK